MVPLLKDHFMQQIIQKAVNEEDMLNKEMDGNKKEIRVESVKFFLENNI